MSPNFFYFIFFIEALQSCQHEALGELVGADILTETLTIRKINIVCKNK